MEITTELIQEKIKFVELCNASIIHEVESSKIINKENKVIIELRYTKKNLIYLDDCLVRPKYIECWKSGKCTLWYSHQKGKSFSQYNFPSNIKFIK